MGEGRGSGGIISHEQLNQLVVLFDRSEYAQEPDSREAKEAESEFNGLVDQLYQNAIENGLALTPAGFKALVRRRCQARIVADIKKPPTMPPTA